MMRRQMFRFGLIGAVATAVQLAIGAMLIHAGYQPILANVISFLIAFGLSFIGHFRFSFANQDSTLITSLRRFSIVAVAGLSFNVSLLTFLLPHTSIPAMLAFILTTGLAAVLTFLLSRGWAFNQHPKRHVSKLGSLQ